MSFARSVSREIRGHRQVISWEHVVTVPQKAEQYERFVMALCQNNRYIKLFQQSFHAGFEDEVHAIANSIVNIAYDLDYCLPIVKAVIESAMDSAEEPDINSVFPEHSLPGKMLECFAFKITPIFLHSLMVPLFERFEAVPGDSQGTLLGDVDALMARLTSPEATSLLPRAIRCLGYVVNNKCRAHSKFGPHAAHLVVGPVLLRVVMPVLLEPEYYNHPVDPERSPDVHKRLDVLQNFCRRLATNAKFGSGLPNEFLNPKLDEYTKQLGAWADAIIADPEQQPNTPPWPEAFHANLPSALDFDDLSPLDLVRLHHAIEALAEFVASSHAHRRGDAATMSEINAMLRDCPIMETPEMPSAHATSLSRFSSFVRFSRVSMSPGRRFTLAPRSHHVAHSDLPSLSFDERADPHERVEPDDPKNVFFFATRITTEEKAVGLLFNFVVRKLDARVFTDRTALLEHVEATITKALKGADSKLHVFADVLFDFSYAQLSPRWLHCLMMLLPAIFAEIKPEWTSLLRRVYVLNPCELYFHLKQCIALAGLDSKVEVIETRQWKNIRALVGAPKSLHLPDDTTAFIEGSHFAWKQGEQQPQSPPRTLVFGPQSLFEFEGRELRSDIKLAQLVTLVHHTSKVAVEYVDGEGSKPRAVVFDFRDPHRADKFINDLVHSLVSQFRNIALLRNEETQFPVVKGQLGRKQSRVMVVVRHGLLNLQASSLRSVLSFHDMKSVRLDDNNPCILVDMGDKQYTLQPSSHLDSLCRLLLALKNNYPRKAAKLRHAIRSDINQLTLQHVVKGIKL